MRDYSKKLTIKDKNILVFDGLFTEKEIKHHFALFSLADYTFLHSSRKDTVAYREWAASFSVEDFREHSLHQVLSDVAQTHSKLKSIECYDVFCSASTFGNVSFIHSDSPTEDTVSVLYYCNSSWDSEWGGETIFYDDNDDAEAAISIKPGRVVVFDGALKHRAGVPNRTCPEVRITLSVRFDKE